CKIVPEHVIVQREIPSMFVEVTLRNAQLYLNQQQTPALEAEGYARELMRRVQQARKEAGLQKTDRIHLTLQTTEDLRSMLNAWTATIQEKVGAIDLKFSGKMVKPLYQKEEQIRNHKMTIEFTKV
ncbi:MAG TPA: DUF5915 domain-containing protein, partial [Candidatus Nanoarchaeia archaeon]|nr:DUF5915 domain-containing protein [Candidatus Nanoarchaeia archaeon]